MCKIHSAIYELARHVESDILICTTGDLHIEGQLHKCDWFEGQDKCYDDVITLKDAIATRHDGTTHEYKWINIASKQIRAFAFKCCLKN